MTTTEAKAIDPHQVMNLVEECSATSLTLFRVEKTTVDNKLSTGFDPVTEADRHVEERLRSGLTDLYGELPIIGEEHGVTGDPTSGLAWIIDPIDGTRAFISGQPQWGTLLGLLRNGTPVGGWLYMPVLRESLWSLHGQAGGSSPHPHRGRVSECTELGMATMVSTHPSMFQGRDADRFWTLEAVVNLSRFGGDCHNYALLANGDIDLVVENQMQTYDILPLVPIVESAGGVVTDGNGDPPLDGGMIIAAATQELHGAALAAMNEP